MKAIEAFRRHGVDVSKVNSTTLRTPNGMQLAVENVVDRCRDVDRRHWNDIIDMQVTTMLEAERLSDPARLAALPDDEFYMRVRERIMPPVALAPIGEENLRYSRSLIDGQRSPRLVLNLSFPDLALTVTDSLLENRNLDTAWAFGRENTAMTSVEQEESLFKDGIAVQSFRGDSIYLASMVAHMPMFTAKHLGPAPFGVLFVAPNAYEIDAYCPRDFDEATRAPELLLDVAHLLHRTAPSPLSTDVFFFRDGEYCQVFDRRRIAQTGVFADTLIELAQR